MGAFIRNKTCDVTETRKNVISRNASYRFASLEGSRLEWPARYKRRVFASTPLLFRNTPRLPRLKRLLAQQMVMLEGDAGKARARVRAFMRFYLNVPPYQRNFKAMGFSYDDLRGGGRDHLIDSSSWYPRPCSVTRPFGASVRTIAAGLFAGLAASPVSIGLSLPRLQGGARPDPACLSR
jgi:hypothetical protein